MLKSGTGIFCVLRGRNSAPFPMEFRWVFFPILKKNPNLQKKKIFFWEDGIFTQSTHTHKLHGDILLHLNGNSMCNS